MRANQNLTVSFRDFNIGVSYLDGNLLVPVAGGSKPTQLNHASWNFINGEYNETIYLSLAGIPPQLFGKVPLQMYFAFELMDPAHAYPNFIMNWEVTVYDIYPP
jgi:hypothetical protein